MAGEQSIIFPSTGDVGKGKGQQQRSLTPGQQLALESLVPAAAVIGTALGGPVGGVVAAGVAGVGKAVLGTAIGRGGLGSETLGATADILTSLLGVGALRAVGKIGQAIKSTKIPSAAGGLGAKVLKILGLLQIAEWGKEVIRGGEEKGQTAPPAGGAGYIPQPPISTPPVGGGRIVSPSRPLPETPVQGRTPDLDIPGLILPRFSGEPAQPVPVYVPDALRTSATQTAPLSLLLYSVPTLPRLKRNGWLSIFKAYPAAQTMVDRQIEIWESASQTHPKQPITPPKAIAPWRNPLSAPLNSRLRLDISPEIAGRIAALWGQMALRPLLSHFQSDMRVYAKKPWEVRSVSDATKAPTPSGFSVPSPPVPSRS